MTKRGKGARITAITDASGSISVWTTGACTHEVKPAEQTIDERFIREKPKRIIGDLALDSDHWMSDREKGNTIPCYVVSYSISTRQKTR